MSVQSVGPSLTVTPDGTTYVAGSTMSSAYNNLRGKLTDARDALRRGNIAVARNKLGDVIDYCQRQSGKTLSVAAASALITDAQFVLGTL